MAFIPGSREFLLVSKEPWKARFFRLEIPTLSTIPSRLTKTDFSIAKIVGDFSQPMVTACDISTDGRQLILVDYAAAAMFKRIRDRWEYAAADSGEAIFKLPRRRQGESVAFTDTGHIWVGSEFTPSPLWKVKIPDQLSLEN